MTVVAAALGANHPWMLVVVIGNFFACVIGAVLVFAVGLALHYLGHKGRPQVNQRGFEVKLSLGKTPGLLEKENDHG